ncbi:SMP-30/gluconolactonase/LRE family protein [Actinomadura verrucosospora]|uniref:SMP-30/gluconolaconase/LRE domain-containing protein n=1 Tax=Actinomadura verrucosospora TaxID=46165 RepID=A0A7D3ZPH6_ACTVE|nr:SMP-30/gluconolactonase/LRE family protein [Actinomadura verrucosospora]QKG25721.1 SMP-30/gluconolaconase/LRE domain-containing protein [Actinomadura verrucosospora]
MPDARVFFDGLFSSPRLDHPECVAVHPDGSVWCGGEAGQIFRVDPAGESVEQVATTHGFVLGIAFDASASHLYICDIKYPGVFRLDLATGEVALFADGADGHRFVNPNYPVIDAAGRIYVSDSRQIDAPGPSVFRYAPDGTGEVWDERPMAFANGLALAPDGSALYVAESFLPGITRVEIRADGTAGDRSTVAELPGTVPDGIAFGPDGLLYVGLYEPSEVLRLTPDGRPETVVRDPTAHLLCHPTNLAFRGTTAFVANLGRWHITAFDL